jgi:ribonucleoside-diphosphate reductase alpha chain
VPDRALWLELAQASLACGDPGVLYIDTIRRSDNLGLSEHITACNPCGEQPLPPWGACLLASIDLTRVIRSPYTPFASIDLGALERLTRTGVALLDEAIDHCHFPWPQQAILARQQRRVGLGLLGLADALILLGLRYDTAQGRAAARQIMRTIQWTAWEASIERARGLGPCPASNPEHLLWPGHSASRLPPRLHAAIRRYGVRNTHLTCIAPTGTLSLAWADNASPGIEPVFSPEGRRPRGSAQAPGLLPLTSPALRRWQAMQEATRRPPCSTSPWPAAWVTRDETPAAAQIAMVGALQPWVDGGISKTLTLGPGCTPEEVAHWYELAWRCGLKGLTIYQDRPRKGDHEARGRLQACTCTPASSATGSRSAQSTCPVFAASP